MYENVSHLLTQVGLITRKYDDIAAITGEKFNIFSIMRMESNEIYTHSAFIAELLNPQGSHGLNDELLKLFLTQLDEQFKIENELTLFRLDTNRAYVVVEEHQGVINDEKQTGGRIDIVIKDNSGNAIVVENKIYASEQGYQLSRYKNAYKSAPILFLTLDGHKPTSCGELIENEHYFCISYEKTILNWLEECSKAAVALPMLREVIRQYIYLIKKLTNQTTNKKMEQEISNLLQENIQASFTISNNLINLKKKLVKKLESELQGYANKNGFDFESDFQQSENNFYKKEQGFYFKPHVFSEKQFRICLRFESVPLEKLWIGITDIEKMITGEKSLLYPIFKNKNFKYSDTNIWKYIFEGPGLFEDWIKFDNGLMKIVITGFVEDINKTLTEIFKN